MAVFRSEAGYILETYNAAAIDAMRNSPHYAEIFPEDSEAKEVKEKPAVRKRKKAE